MRYYGTNGSVIIMRRVIMQAKKTATVRVTKMSWKSSPRQKKWVHTYVYTLVLNIFT